MTASNENKPLPSVPSMTIPRTWLRNNDYATPRPHTPKLVSNVSPASPILLWPHSLTYGSIDPTIDLDLYSPTVHTADSVWIIYSGKAELVDLHKLANTRHPGPGQVVQIPQEIGPPLSTRATLSPQLLLQGAYHPRLPNTRSSVVRGTTGRSLRSSMGRPRVETSVFTGNPGASWATSMQGLSKISVGLLNAHLDGELKEG